MNAYYELDSAMRELMWHQSMSILASYGGYNSYEVAGKTANADDLMRLKNRIGWNQESLGSFRRALRRDRDLPLDEAARAQSIVDSYSAFIDAARAVVAHLDDGDPGAANLAYRDDSVPLSKDIGADLYTLRRAARDRVAEIEKSLR